MGNLGTSSQAVNAKQMQVFIGSASNEWLLVQNARMLISHPVFREATTSGGIVTYTGAPDNTISGTLLFTRDEWDDGSSNDLKSLITPSNGEVPASSWLVKFTDVSGASTNTTFTFTNCKLSVMDVSKSAEGAVKVDITVICPGEQST